MRTASLSLAVWLSATATLPVTATTHYVDLNCTNSTPPYTNWETAATSIRQAVGVCHAFDEIVVTNGVYETGSLGNARVYLYQGVTLRSVNGPGVTAIKGYLVPGTGFGPGALNCVEMNLDSKLIGFTLTGGGTLDWSGADYYRCGGGVRCLDTSCVVSNCIITGNVAHASGGAAYSGTLKDCILAGNVAGAGGGAAYSVLTNCLLNSNQGAVSDGGARYSTLYNCLVCSNTAPVGYCASLAFCVAYNCTVVFNLTADSNGINYNSIVYYNGVFPWSSDNNSHCCVQRVSVLGPGSFTNAPLFVDQAKGDFRLQTNSPCINAGLNAYAPGATDLSGNPRIVGGTVDVGAYECQSPALLDFYSWLQGYGLPTDASAVYADADSDHHNNWQEWVAGTNPTNAASVLVLAAPAVGAGSVTLTWSSVTSRAYFVERATSLASPPAFSLLQSNIPGQAGTTSFTDTSPPPGGPAHYRVGVHQ